MARQARTAFSAFVGTMAACSTYALYFGALASVALVMMAPSAVRGMPIVDEPASLLGSRASPLSASQRYGINTELSTCLQSKHIDFVDAMRNDSHVYFEASQGDNVRFHWHPVAIVFPQTVQQTSEAVQCAAQNGNVQTVARSGGHAFHGYSSGGQDGAMIVDFREMASIVSDSAHALVHIQPGARLGDVAKSLWADGKRAMPHGTCPTVGVGGHSLCGGVGPLSRKWGMATDNMVEAELVLADGRIVHASQHENADLWWALRGAGSFYGLVTRFTFSTYNVDFACTSLRYRWGVSIKSADDAVKLMQAIQAFAQRDQLPGELGFHVQVEPARKDAKDEVITLQLKGMYLGAKQAYVRDVIPALWSALGDHGMPTTPDLVEELEMPYIDLMKAWDEFGAANDKLNTQLERKSRNNFATRTSLSMTQKGFSATGFKTIFKMLWQQQSDELSGKLPSHNVMGSSGEHTYWVWNMYFELFGGANNRMRDDVLVSRSAMAHRDGFWLMQASVGSTQDKPLVHGAYAMVHRIDSAVHTALQDDHTPRMGYSCYADPTLDDWAHQYYGDSVARMTELKQKFDATNLFRNPQSLIATPPRPGSGGAAQSWLSSPHPLP